MDVVLVGLDERCGGSDPLSDFWVVEVAVQANRGLTLSADRRRAACYRLDVVFSVAVRANGGSLDPIRKRTAVVRAVEVAENRGMASTASGGNVRPCDSRTGVCTRVNVAVEPTGLEATLHRTLLIV